MHPKWNKHKDKEYEKWIKQKECLVCGQSGVDPHHGYNARRNDFLVVPLCRAHHREYHDTSCERFEKKHNIDFKDEIINFLSEYIEGLKDGKR